MSLIRPKTTTDGDTRDVLVEAATAAACERDRSSSFHGHTCHTPHVTHHMSHVTSSRAGQAHLIHVALAAGMHGLTDGALAPQFFDVPQKALDRLVLQRQGEIDMRARRARACLLPLHLLQLLVL